jgi:hypothetical protein
VPPAALAQLRPGSRAGAMAINDRSAPPSEPLSRKSRGEERLCWWKGTFVRESCERIVARALPLWTSSTSGEQRGLFPPGRFLDYDPETFEKTIGDAGGFMSTSSSPAIWWAAARSKIVFIQYQPHPFRS